MIALYYVIDETEVTHQADINRKALAMELSVFCFQWVVTFWTSVLIIGLYSLLNRNRPTSRWTKLALFICVLATASAFGYLYYRNLQVLLAARDLNVQLSAQEIDAPAQSNFIVISFWVLLWFANFSWFIMNFFLGVVTAAALNDCMSRRRRRYLTEQERQRNAEQRKSFLDSLKDQVDNLYL